MTFWITPRLGTNAEGELYEPGVVIVNVSDLIDGANSPHKIGEKLILAKTILQDFLYTRVIIQCHGGVSRSNTIAAGVLSMVQGMDFDDVLGFVAQKVSRAQYNYDLVDSVRATLKQFES